MMNMWRISKSWSGALVLMLALVVSLGVAGCQSKEQPLPNGQPKNPKPAAPKDVQELNNIRNHLIKVAADAGEAPADFEAAKAAYKKASKFNWPKDSHGHAYVYEKGTETAFKVYSLGPDGEPGTEDDVFPSEDVNTSMRD